MTAFFICSCAKDTGTRTKSFHRKVSYKKDSTLKPRFFQKFRKFQKKISSKFQKKFFFKKIFLSPWKTLSSRLSLKKSKKKFFFGQIGLDFFAYHDQLVDRTVLRVVPIERKSIFAYLRFHQKNIFKMNHFQILSERPKMFIFEHFGTNGLNKLSFDT